MDRTSRPPEQTADPAPLRAAFDGFLLDEADVRLSLHERAIALPPRAFAVLCCLVRQAGRMVSKDALLDAVWGHRHVSESVLKSTISQVRAALADPVKQPRYIETASRHGYRFIGQLRPCAPTVALERGAAGLTLIGREQAMRRLDQIWTQARGGQTHMLWVSGESGIGKTTLIDHWLATVRPERIARGHCIEPFGTGEPYLPLLEALAMLCRTEPQLPDLLRRFAPAWLLQLPWLHAAGELAELGVQLAGASQDRMLRELCELLAHSTHEQALVLVLEDLHWSDVSTLRFLDYLARRRDQARLLVIGSFRPSAQLAASLPTGECEAMTLEPLSGLDVAELLQRSWPEAVNPQLADAVHAHTEGLPVFVVHVIDDLKRRAADIVRDPQLWRQGLAVPERLFAVIAKQLQILTTGQQALLRAASVRGPGFSQHCIGAILSLEPSSLLDDLAALARTGPWIEETGIERLDDGVLRATYRFRHVLYQQAIYAEWPAAPRAEAHLRLAHALAARVQQGETIAPVELALHFERGLDFVNALRWQAAAAASALARFAPREAADHAEHGLQLLQRVPQATSVPQAISLHLSRGVAAAQLHGVGSVAALDDLEHASKLSESLPQSAAHVWLLNGLGWTYFSRGDFAEAASRGMAMAQQAELGADPLLMLCAANLLGATCAYSAHLDAALDWLDRALLSLEVTETGAVTVHSIVDLEVSVRVYRAQVLAHRGQSRLALAEAEAGLLRARRLRQPMSLCLALRSVCLLAIRRDDLDALNPMAAELLELASTHGVAQSLGPARWYRGWAMARAGELEAGVALVRAGLESHQKLGMATGCALAYGYVAQICMWQGELQAAQTSLAAGLALARHQRETLDQPFLHRLWAQIATAQGELQRAEVAEQQAQQCAASIGAVLT